MGWTPSPHYYKVYTYFYNGLNFYLHTIKRYTLTSTMDWSPTYTPFEVYIYFHKILGR